MNNIGVCVQVTMLQMAHQQNPNGRWWIKADGCDILKGLCESTTHQWSGDVDMNDGAVQEHHRRYMYRLNSTSKLISQIPPQPNLSSQLSSLMEDLQKDLTFIESGEVCHNTAYIRGLMQCHCVQV